MVVNAEGVREWSSTPKAFANGRQRRRRGKWSSTPKAWQMVVNAEGVANGRQRRRRSQVSAQGCFNPGLASIAKGNAEGVGQARLANAFSVVKISFWRATPGCFNPGLASIAKGNAEGIG